MLGDLILLFVLLWLIWLTIKLVLFSLKSMFFPQLDIFTPSGIIGFILQNTIGSKILLPVSLGALAVEIVGAVLVARKIF